MFWIVQKSHPKPENYIPVFIRSSIDKRFREEEFFEIFNSEEKAIAFALALKTTFGIANIRIFHEGGHSKIWKSS